MAAEPRTKPVSGEPSSNGRLACAPAGVKDNGLVAALQNQTAIGSGSAGAEAAAPSVQMAIECFEGPLVRYAARVTGDVERGRDVVQETFLRLCREPAVATSGRLAQWLFTVCRRLAVDVRRKEKRMSTQLGSSAVCNVPARATGRTGMEMSEEFAKVLRHLGGLSPNQQEVVRLKFQEGMSYQQIAAITALSVSNVGYLLHTAVHALREKMITNA